MHDEHESNTGGKLVVSMVGIESEEALAHVHQALSYSDQEQHGGLLVVIATQAPQQPCQPGVVCAAANNPCTPLRR